MKRKLLFIATIALVFGATSCTKEKDTDQTPSDTTQTPVGKHISKVYLTSITTRFTQSDSGWVETSSNTAERRLTEEYIWENGRLVELKEYSVGDVLRCSMSYTYDENSRLTKIEEDNDNHYIYTFGYDDNGRLVSRKFFSSDQLVRSWDYTYTGDCITSCYYVSNIYYTDSSEHNSYHLTYQSSNGNIVSETSVNDATNVSTTTTFTYDNKHNPFYGVLSDEDNIVFWYSKSNRLIVDKGDGNPVGLSYEYDSDGYPTSCESTLDMVMGTTRSRIISKFDYEYER